MSGYILDFFQFVHKKRNNYVKDLFLVFQVLLYLLMDNHHLNMKEVQI